MEEEIHNPCDFNEGDIIRNIYTDDRFRVEIPDKHGMAVLFNLKSRKDEDWNAENNFIFTKLEGQLELF